jgi:hypothetical protein
MMAMRERSGSTRLMVMTAILFAGLAVSTGGAQAPATSPALKPGTASGTLTVGKTTVTLAHAYVAGPTSDIYIVELTDKPIPDADLGAELKRGGGQRQLRSGAVQGILLYVSPQGFVQTAIPFVGELRGEKMLASVGPLTTFAIAAGQATGVGSIAAAKYNQDWSFQARFAAAVRPVQ